MPTVVAVVLALVGGFFVGIVASEISGIVGLLVFDDVVGIRFLPVITALVAAAAAVVVTRRARRDPRP